MVQTSGQARSGRQLLNEASRLVVMHKVVAARSVLGGTRSPTAGDVDGCLAFELGIATHFYDCLIATSRAVKALGVESIDDFLLWHARQAYGPDAEWVYRRWRGWLTENAMAIPREYGKTAAREATSADGMHRPGERAAALLSHALRVMSEKDDNTRSENSRL